MDGPGPKRNANRGKPRDMGLRPPTIKVVLMKTYLLYFGICFIGSMVQGAVSFGYAIVVMALLPLLMPVKIASVLTVINSLVIGGTVCWKWRKSIDFRAIRIPLLIGLAFIPVGVVLLSVLHDPVLKKMLGAVIIVLALASLVAARRELPFRPTFHTQFAVGAVSGLLDGLFNVGGPPMVFYLLAQIKENVAYKASLEFVFIILMAATFLSHLFMGNITSGLIPHIVLGCLAVIGGTFMGLTLFQKLKRYQLKKLVYGMMMILGMLLMGKG
jgi:uncharacterized membrane protein YfcA